MDPLFLLGGAGVTPLVQDLGLCLLAAGALAVVFERLRVPSIAALLAAGVAIGPVGLALIGDKSNVETIANLGLTLLLFVIGLEVNLRGLLASGKTLLVTGALQVPITVGIAFALFLGLAATGWASLSGRYTALYFALACGFSSTLLVVKFLQAHLQLDTVVGRLCVGLLIFQDVWAIIVLAVQPSFERPAVEPILLTFAGIGIVAAVAVGVARFVLPTAFRIVGRSPELVVTAALGWCFGLGLFGAHLGDVLALVGVKSKMSVSMEMGALIAGASIASFPYAYEVVARVTHLRDFFVTLFFVGLGMSIPIPDGIEVVALALVLSAVAILLRYLVFLPILYWTGLDRRNALDTSTKLAQISEFCLVIAYLGMQFGHLSETQVSVVIFAFIVTALVTPALFKVSEHLYRQLRPILSALGFKAPPQAGAEDKADTAPRLVLLGFHRTASALLHEVERAHGDLLPHTLVVDINVALHDAIRARGVQVVYGDIASMETLRHAGVGEAEVIATTIPDELLKGTSNAQIVRQLRALAPKAMIFATASRPSQAREILAAGADHVFFVHLEAAQGLLAAISAALNASLPSFHEMRTRELGSLAERREILD